MYKYTIVQQLKDKLRMYVTKFNMTEEDVKYLNNLLEEAYNTGDHDGWYQALEQMNDNARAAERHRISVREDRHQAYGNDSFD